MRTGALLVALGAVNGAQTGALTGLEAFRVLARVNVASTAVGLPITLFLAWKWQVAGAVWALVLGQGFACLMSFCALTTAARSSGIPLSRQGCLVEAPLLWRFSLPTVLASAFATPAMWAASALLVNQPRGYLEMGVFGAVSRLRQVPEMILSVIVAPLIPVLSELRGRGDSIGFRKAVLSAYLLSTGVVGPICLLQIAVPQITYLPFGDAYKGSSALVQWMMLHCLLAGVFFPLGLILVSLARVWLNLALSAGFAFAYLLMAWQTVPRFGAAGLAAAQAVGYCFVLGPTLLSLYSKAEDAAFLDWRLAGRLTAAVFACATLCAAGSHHSVLGGVISWCGSMAILLWVVLALVRRMRVLAARDSVP
jgi:O-antigen/teichoic acid export membrane protein